MKKIIVGYLRIGFILSGLIKKYGSGKNTLYVAFLDLRNAFDNVNRILLKKASKYVF